jgi:hypothetical protein
MALGGVAMGCACGPGSARRRCSGRGHTDHVLGWLAALAALKPPDGRGRLGHRTARGEWLYSVALRCCPPARCGGFGTTTRAPGLASFSVKVRLFVVLAVALAACSSPTPPPAPSTQTVTVTAAAPAPPSEPPPSAPPTSSAPPPGPGPHSQLIDVTFPAGSTGGGGPSTPGVEAWHVPLEVSDTVAYLRPQLPINGPLDAIPWCADDSSPKLTLTQWTWATNTQMIVVGVSPYYAKVGVRGPGSEVDITRGPDNEGCT